MAPLVERIDRAIGAAGDARVVRHQHQPARELLEALFKHFERGKIEVVCRLVKDQHVRRLEHEPSDVYARLLAARECPDRTPQLLLCEQEHRRPCRDVQQAITVHHAVRRRQRFGERRVGIKFSSVLTELNDSEALGPPDGAQRRRAVRQLIRDFGLLALHLGRRRVRR